MANFKNICIRKRDGEENLELKRPALLDMTFDLTYGYLTAIWMRHPKFKDTASGEIISEATMGNLSCFVGRWKFESMTSNFRIGALCSRWIRNYKQEN